MFAFKMTVFINRKIKDKEDRNVEKNSLHLIINYVYNS